MTSRLRSGTSIPKERSKATFLGSDTFYYEPEDGTGKGYGRAKHENSYRFGDFREACHESNGRRYSEETEEDPDFLYKRSKDRFGSWDIGDIAGDTSRRPKDGKFERTIAEKSKNILGPREEERNGPRRDGDTTDKMRKEKKLDSSRNGTFLGESLKIRRNGESEKKASFPSSSVDGLPVSSVDDTTIDRTRTSEENDVEGDPRHPRHHRHRHRRRYIFDGAFGDDDLPEDASCKETSRDIDRRRSGNVEKVSRSYEHLIADKDSSILRGEEERTPRYAAAQVASDETNDERNDVVRDVEDRDFEGEEHDPRGLKENSSRKSNRYAIESPRKRTTFNDVVVQEGEDEGTGLEDNARRAGHSFAYAGQSTEDFDVRIRRYERGLPALGRDSNVSKRAAVYRALDRTPSKRDSSKEHDRNAIGRNSFSDVGASRKSSTKEIDSTATTTRRPTQKDQGNGIPSRNLIKIDHAGGIMCTIKSRSNDATEGNCFQGESTDLRRKCSFKEQRPELGKVSFETERGEIPDERSSFRDRRTHGGTSDRIFLRLEKAGDERKRTFLYESPSSSFDRISSDNQKRRVSTSNERNAKSTESAKTTTKSTTGRRRRISFKDRELDRPERRDSYADKDSNEDETIRRSDCSFDEGFETSEFDRNNSVNRERNGRYRLKKTIDGDRRDVDSRAYTPKEHAASSEKKYERHSEVLTPPRGRGGGGGVEDPIRSNETWREDNRLFATRYLRENGRATVRKDNNVHGEGGRDSGPDLADVRSISVNGPRQDRANNRIGPDTRGGVASTVERNGTTIVRILTEAGETTSSRGDLERRRRRCPVQQELCLQHRRKKFDASRYDSEEETVPGEKTGIAVKEEARKERKQVLERDHEEEEEEEEEVVVVEVEDEVERDHEEEQEEEEENDDGIEYRQNFWRRSRRNDRLMPGIAGSAPSRRLWNYREGVWHFSESIAFDRTFTIQRREATFINRWRR